MNNISISTPNQMTIQDVLERQIKAQIAVRLHYEQQRLLQEIERRFAVLRQQIWQGQYGIRQPENEPSPDYEPHRPQTYY